MSRILAWVACLAACGAPAPLPCIDMTPPGELVTRALLFRVEVHEVGARCDEGAAPLGSPVLTRTFAAGAPLAFEVAAGRRAVVLSAFADVEGTTLLGRACTEADLGAGRKVCLDLRLAAPPDFSFDPPDLAQPVSCLSDPSICGSGVCCDGLCRDVTADIQHCGGCRACSAAQVATPACGGGLCTSTCLAPYGNCSTPAAPAPDDGCETDLDTTPTRCGACDRACASAGADALRCAGGRCTSTCTAGLGNCTQPAAPAADDGCETTLTSSTAHCGACGRPCSTSDVAVLACDTGVCTSSCQGGRVNCARPAAPGADDGCECAGDACCPGSSCQTQHANGLGQTFRDCVTLGTHTLAQATAARAAWPFTATSDFQSNGCASGTPMLCRQTATTCACWGYGAGPAIGLAKLNAASNTCPCPQAGDPTWN